MTEEDPIPTTEAQAVQPHEAAAPEEDFDREKLATIVSELVKEIRLEALFIEDHLREGGDEKHILKHVRSILNRVGFINAFMEGEEGYEATASIRQDALQNLLHPNQTRIEGGVNEIRAYITAVEVLL